MSVELGHRHIDDSAEQTTAQSRARSAAGNVLTQLAMQAGRKDEHATGMAVLENQGVLAEFFGQEYDAQLASEDLFGAPETQEWLRDGVQLLKKITENGWTPEEALVVLEDRERLVLTRGEFDALHLYARKYDEETLGHEQEEPRRQARKDELFRQRQLAHALETGSLPFAHVPERENTPEHLERAQSAARNAIFAVLIDLYGRPSPKSNIDDFIEMSDNLAAATNRFQNETAEYVGRFSRAIEEATLTLQEGIEEQFLPNEMLSFALLYGILEKDEITAAAIYSAGVAYAAIWGRETTEAVSQSWNGGTL